MTTATITDRSALAAALRELKLSGMLDTLDARLVQARAGDLGHLDFLQVLCQDEISRRETTSLQRRIRAARFETPATLEGFDFAASPKLPAAQIRDLAALRWLQPGESVILYGPVGVGKSHVAQALAHLAIRSGADARFLKTSRALAHLAGGHADRTWDKRLRELIRPAVLVLDDFAMREFTAAQADDLYELISERAGKSTIFTSNRAPADWYPLFPNPVVAESLLDRVINTSHQVVMNGPSYRPANAPGASSPLTPRAPARMRTRPGPGELLDRRPGELGERPHLVDPARVATDQPVISRSCQDGMKQPVRLGHCHRPERTLSERASIKPRLAPATDGSLIDPIERDRAEGRQQVIAEQARVKLPGPGLEHPVGQPLIRVVLEGDRPGIRVCPVAA